MDKDKSSLRKDYDNLCKNILSRKFMLACIMKACIDEYKDCDTQDIINKYIKGEPEIGTEPLYVDDITMSSQIDGLNTEDSSIKEGYITYDIKYKALLPNSDKKASLIINIEAQYNEVDYSIMKRAEFYIGRLISSQKNREFIKSEYDKINKVYSIWIFTSSQKGMQSSITEYKTKEYNRLGNYHEKKSNYDFFDIIMIRLGDKEVEDTDNHDNPATALIQILKQVFTKDIKEPKISVRDILRDTFRLNIKEDRFYQGVDNMCNLSEGIFAAGIEQGKIEGKIEGMLLVGTDIDKISSLTGMGKDKILEIKRNMKEEI